MVFLNCHLFIISNELNTFDIITNHYTYHILNDFKSNEKSMIKDFLVPSL